MTATTQRMTTTTEESQAQDLICIVAERSFPLFPSEKRGVHLLVERIRLKL